MWPLVRSTRRYSVPLLMVALLATVVARPAAAEGINLSWDECGAAGVGIKTFACNSGSVAPMTLIGSFTPPAGVNDFLGTSAVIRVTSKNLPNWWALGEIGCRSGSLTSDFRFAANGACTDFYDDEAVGGFLYEVGGFGTNTARLTVQSAVPYNKRGAVSPSKEYYAFKLLLVPDRVSQCAGCTIPVSLRLNSIQLFQPIEIQNDPIITTPLNRSVAHWQAPAGELPQLSSVTPGAGAPGDEIALAGLHLDGTSAVRFNGISATFTVVSSQLVRAIVPAGARSGPVVVSTPFGDATGPGTFTVAPVIQTFLPRQAPAGTSVDVRGFNFQNVTGVKFGSIDATFQIVSDTQLRANVPAGAVDAPISVSNAASSGNSPTPFQVGALAGVLNLSWDDCGRAGSEIKEFACNRNNGSGFSLIGSFAPPSGVDQLTGLTAEVGIFSTLLPDWWKHGAAYCREGTGLALSLNFADAPGTCADAWAGRASGVIGYDVNYYGPNTARMTVYGSMNETAPVDPRREYYGFKVTILPSRSVTGCDGCDTPVRMILNQIQLLQIPSAGYDPVITSTFERNSALWQGAPGPIPQVTSISPRSGVNGAVVEIEGQFLAATTGVRFGTVPAEAFEVVTDNHIRATVPVGARSGPVQVKTRFGIAHSESIFIAPPMIQTFSPGQAPVGHPIVIDGYNFTRATLVRFNGTAAVFTVTSDTQIDTRVPAGVTDGPISVVNVAGTARSELIFHLGDLPLDPPLINGFTPVAGAPGAIVTVSGIRFTGTTSVRFGLLEAVFNVVSDAALTATVPEGALTAPIRVATPGGNSVSATSFVVAPHIDSFAPLTAGAGEAVTISGRNFRSATNVRFEANAVAAFAIRSDVQIVATVPPSASDGPIRVIGPGGTAVSEVPFTFKASTSVGGLNLSWSDCGAYGDEDKSFVCNSNEGSRFTLVGSFVAPPRITQFLGASAELRVESKVAELPDWWKFGTSQCRSTGFSIDFNFTDGYVACEDFTAGRAAGGYVYEIGQHGPNSVRIRIQYAIPFDGRGPLIEGKEYYSFKVKVPRTRTVGIPSCAGCSEPVNITLREIQLFQPAELNNDPVIETVALRNKVRWQASHTGDNLVSDPSFETSTSEWGPVGGATLAQVAEPHDGASALQVIGPAAAGEFGINDTPNLVASTPDSNRTYRFSAWVRSPAPGFMFQLRAREYANRVRIQTANSPWTATTDLWHEVSSRVTSRAKGSTIDFQIICLGQGPGAELLVDDVEVALTGSEPEIESLRKIDATSGEPLEFEVTVSDPSGAPITSLTADLSELPMLNNATFTVDPGNARGVLRWTPQPEDADWTFNIPVHATSVLEKTRTTQVRVLPLETSASLIPNGSFEDPPSGWRAYDSSTFERVGPGRLGDWAISVHQPDSTTEYGLNDAPNWIRNVPAAGIPYRFACWVRGAFGTGDATLRVREYLGALKIGNSTISSRVALSPEWRQLVVDHVTGAAGSTLDFQVLCDPDAAGTTFVLDDVSIRPLVPPTGIAPAAVEGITGVSYAAPSVFPNPFRHRAMLGLTLARPGPLRIDVYDLNGRRVRRLFDGPSAEAGTHQFELDGRNDRGQKLGPGIFFYRIDTPTGAHQGRFVILE